MKKSVSNILKALLLLSVVVIMVSCDSNAINTSQLNVLDMSSFVCKKVNIVDGSTSIQTIVYLTSNDSQIAFVNKEFVLEILGKQYSVTSVGKNVVIKNNWNNATMTIDTAKKQYVFSDFERFYQKEREVTFLDLTDSCTDDYILCVAGAQKSTGKYTIDYGSYGIQTFAGAVYNQKKGYEPDFLIPLRTFCDLSNGLYSDYHYNGKEIFKTSYSKLISMNNEGQRILTKFGKQYFDNGISSRSAELIDFNYKELILNLEVNYGLKERQGIVSFDKSLTSWGLKDALYSTDPKVSSQAICELVYHYIGDIHSSYGCMTPFSSEYEQLEATAYSSSYAELSLARSEMMLTRAAKMKTQDNPFAYPGFKIIESTYTDYEGKTQNGNTAFITFDRFTFFDINYKDPAVRTALLNDSTIEEDFTKSEFDTIGLIIYANDKIKQWDKDHPDATIKNVVVDLSCNSGGESQTAIFVCCWLLGYCPLSLQSSVTGSQATTYHYADVNMDGIFQSIISGTDYSDSVANKNIFVITSKVSFSCGNIVPCVVKVSRKGILLGSWSGGGACPVFDTGTADGTVFTISGTKRVCYDSNGSFVDIDNGIDVDYKFSKPDQYYEREAIVKKINEQILVKAVH